MQFIKNKKNKSIKHTIFEYVDVDVGCKVSCPEALDQTHAFDEFKKKNIYETLVK